MSDFPTHPIIGFRAIGLTKRGVPIWPVMGASEDHTGPVPGVPDGGGAGAGGDGGGATKANAVDQHGNDLGYPVETAWKDMTAEQQVNYWRHNDRRKADQLKAFEGITPEQAKQWKKDAEDARLNGLPADQRVIEEARTEAAAAAAEAEAAKWAPVCCPSLWMRMSASLAVMMGGL